MKPVIASYKTLEKVLLSNQLYAKKHLGQNFIIDRNIIDKIVTLAEVNQDLEVLEIGPGIGALTQALCEKAKHVYAVEIDETMVTILQETCGDYDNLTIYHEDFLKFDLDQITSDRLMVCANLPYYVTTPILFKLFESKQSFEQIVVMVQKEVASRFKAKKDTKAYNALSIIAQASFEIKEAFEVSRNVFYPKPDVASAILVFKPRSNFDMKANQPLFDFIKACFQFRRKTLANNLKAFVEEPKLVNEYLKQAQLDEGIRAQSCDLEDFKRLFEIISATP